MAVLITPGQLGERAWLYVVTQCRREKPRFSIIKDSASKLDPEMLYRQVQYLVKEDDWKQAGDEVAVQEVDV